jgi:copper(I)-binding protein
MKIVVVLTLLLVTASTASAKTSPLILGPAWSRPAIGTGVVYLTITDTGAVPDRLLAAASPVAQSVELHQSFATHSGPASTAMPGMDMSAVMSMRRVADVKVPAHGEVRFEPGGNHIMLVGLRRDLHANDVFSLRLHFARAGWVPLQVRVRGI